LRRHLPAAIVAAITVAVLSISMAVAAPATATTQHFYTVVETDFFGNATLDLQTPVDPDNVVVKVASGATDLGGQDPSMATVNFAGFVDANTIRVRFIGWHANTETGQADFRYFSNQVVRIAVDVYERTTVPPPAPTTTTLP